jgi:hypothetical protein
VRTALTPSAGPHAPPGTGYPTPMTTTPEDPQEDQTTGTDDHDQDAEPPTPDGQEPDTSRLDPDSEPGSDPDPVPGEE